MLRRLPPEVSRIDVHHGAFVGVAWPSESVFVATFSAGV
jgi:hypothetical protein